MTRAKIWIALKNQLMKCLRCHIAIITIVLASCNSSDDFPFGIRYNDMRQRYGSPLIQHEMKATNCCGVWTEYIINKVPNNKAYHYSKTIRAITENKLTEEKDIFRENLDDTTIVQLNLLTFWNWQDNEIRITGNLGKIDLRMLGIPAKDFIRTRSKYPEYAFRDLDLRQIDSVLHSWNLSRSDKE